MAMKPAVADPAATDDPAKPNESLVVEHNGDPNQGDPDELALAEAKAAIAAEEEGQGDSDAPSPDPVDTAQAVTDRDETSRQDGQDGSDGPDGPDPADPPIMIPKARLDEVLALNRELKGDLSRQQGQIDTLTSLVQGPRDAGAEPGPNTPTIAERRAEARNDLLAATEAYDKAEITSRELEEKRLAYADLEMELRREEQGGAEPVPPPTSVSDQMIEESHITALERNYPYTTVLTDEQIAVLEQGAVAMMAAQGQPFTADPASRMRLRTAIARLSDTWGPQWHPSFVPPAGSKPSTTDLKPRADQPGGQPSGAKPSGPAAARLSKLELAGTHPPDVGDMGSPASGSPLPTEAQIAQMSDDEIDALPPNVRARLLNAETSRNA